MVPEGTDKLSENDELREYELSGSDCMTSMMMLDITMEVSVNK